MTIRCSCRRIYEPEQWAALPLVGEMDDGEGVLMMRQCECLSTVSVHTPSMGRSVARILELGEAYNKRRGANYHLHLRCFGRREYFAAWGPHVETQGPSMEWALEALKRRLET